MPFTRPRAGQKSTNTPTGKSTPDLIAWIQAWDKSLPGASFASDFPGLAQYQGFTLQDVRNQLATSGYSKADINKIVSAKPSALQAILDTIANSAVLIPGVGGSTTAGAGAAGGAADEAAGGVTATEGAAAGAAGVAGTEAVTGISGAIDGVTAFLAWIAWMFNPLNLLRTAEFLVGILIGGFGLYILTQGGGGRTGTTGAIRRIVSVTPAGRSVRMAEGRRMGRREGQRESARMQARQAETRGARESSAVEREKINLDARQTARSSD